MEKTEKLIRKEFERLRERTPPRMLTDLHYDFTPEAIFDKSYVDYTTLVGFINTASQFKVRILSGQEKSIKCRIIQSLLITIDLLEDTIQRLK